MPLFIVLVVHPNFPVVPLQIMDAPVLVLHSLGIKYFLKLGIIVLVGINNLVDWWFGRSAE